MATLYEIKILNWVEHNPGHKKAYKKTLIANNFCSDAKINLLPMSGRWTFLHLLLLCGDTSKDTVTCTEAQLRVMCGSGVAPQKVLDQLQSLQLVEFTKSAPLRIERKEEKRKEEKGNKSTRVSKRSATPAIADVHIGRELVAVYCEEWKAKYGDSPPLRPQDTRQLKAVGETNGLERTKDLIRAYLAMNEAWYLQKRHDLQTFLSNLTAAAQFLESGVLVTRAKLRAVETATNLEDTVRSIREEGI